MSIGNLGAAPGAQPSTTQALGAPIFGTNQGVGNGVPGSIIGAAGDIAPYGGVTYFNSSFESVMAAVSRGELSLNALVANNSYFGGNAANIQAQQGNPTLLQAISQGPSQNGTNGLNGVGAGGGTVNASYASNNTSPGTFDAGFDSTAVIDPKQTVGSGFAPLSAQYGGN